MNIFVAPGDVFNEVRASVLSTANWLVPALIFIAISWAGAAIILSHDSIRHQMSEIATKAVEQQIQKMHMPRDQAEQVRQTAEKWGTIGPVIGLCTSPVMLGLVSPFWWGLILWR